MQKSSEKRDPGSAISKMLKKKKSERNTVILGFILVLLMIFSKFFYEKMNAEPELKIETIGVMNKDLIGSDVSKIKITPDFLYQNFEIEKKDGTKYTSIGPRLESQEVKELVAAGVSVDFLKSPRSYHALPQYLLLGILFTAILVSILQSVGISIARPTKKSLVKFNDVAGNIEAKDACVEVVEYLRDPSKFEKLGAKFPKGLIMAGPPGTGKTLLAKAIAGEADANFIAISASDFSSMFVGVSGMKVKSTFARARRNAPCVLFIDEIDAVGQQRLNEGSSVAREMGNTLNSMLVQMDGFESNSGVIVIAATNRLEVLDAALLRSGRFDRHIHLGLPTLNEREDILKIHGRNLSGNSFDYRAVAKACVGMSGADMENLVNQAALIAVKQDAESVTTLHGLQARDRLIMGDARLTHSQNFDDNTRRVLACHEAGHAIVGLVYGPDPVTRVSIIPRGQSLGQTMMAPAGERVLHDKNVLLNQTRLLLGGRAAEMHACNTQTTGASDDLNKASAIVMQLIGTYGMHDCLLRVHEGSSDSLRYKAEKAAEELLQSMMKDALKAIVDNQHVFDLMVAELIATEEIFEDQIIAYSKMLVTKKSILDKQQLSDGFQQQEAIFA